MFTPDTEAVRSARSLVRAEWYSELVLESRRSEPTVVTRLA